MIIISACLIGKNCRYDGSSNLIPDLKNLHANSQAIALCPEVLGGLDTPRLPCEIVLAEDACNGYKVLNKNNEDCTIAFENGAKKALEIALKHNAKIAILKANSPSCGCGKIYDGSFTKTLIDGEGLTAKLFKEHGIVIYNELNYHEIFDKKRPLQK